MRQRTFIPDEFRFGLALYELRCGNDLSWGFWLTSVLSWGFWLTNALYAAT